MTPQAVDRRPPRARARRIVRIVTLGVVLLAAHVAVARPVTCDDRRKLRAILAENYLPHDIESCRTGRFGAPGVVVVTLDRTVDPGPDANPAKTVAVIVGDKPRGVGVGYSSMEAVESVVVVDLDGDGHDEVVVRHQADSLQEHLTTLSVLRPNTDELETIGDIVVDYWRQADPPNPPITCRSTVSIAKGTITVKMKRSDDVAECPATGVHRFALAGGKLAETK